MPSFQLFHLRLCAIQGACLAIGFWLFFMMLPEAQPARISEIFPRPGTPGIQQQADAPHFKAVTVAFLGTWALLAGFTGLLIMRDNARRMRELLQEYSSNSEPQLRLCGVEEESSEISPGAPSSAYSEGVTRLRLYTSERTRTDHRIDTVSASGHSDSHPGMLNHI